jgi:exopolysaccharide biosynthesis polyprenyl glycosylphosphotransferase
MRSRLGSHSQRAWTDGSFAFVMALGSVVYGNSARVPLHQLEHFLEIRITVLNAAFAGLFMLIWAFCFRALGLYRLGSYTRVRKVARIVLGCGLMSVVLFVYLEVARTTGPSLRIALLFFSCSCIYELLRVFGTQWMAARDPQLLMILGTGRRAEKAWREIRTRCHGTIRLVGFVDNRSREQMTRDIADRHLGTIDDLSNLLLKNVVDELLVAVPMKSCYDVAQQAIGIAEQVGVRVCYMQDMYTTTLNQGSFSSSDPFSELLPLREGYVVAQALKRIVDVVSSLFGLFLLLPIFALVALAVRLTSKGPVFFSQDRFGHRRRIFRMYKFRSMVSNASELMAQLETQNEARGPIFKIRRDPRITPIGRFLRASSLDELPQLWNVLIGNMSLVGPRPMSVRDVSLFSEATLMRRFTVKPGITGLWQVSGRSSVGFEKWIELDFSYIDRWSLALDFQILARTVGAVLRGTGAV